ncbi:hypothetical protein PFISCL1PPCAC_26246 [Pristionchus fissidentatus]|uniref:Uncharacterized protein n=1 Tax=Pristionchus fissidentatus TaxID=1538716 RepID=A0AAV5WWD7_9BILA|nr:hypothetical protein PFISCL1PPCAC_26246 [Pristionchus fissidentatus]
MTTTIYLIFIALLVCGAHSSANEENQCKNCDDSVKAVATWTCVGLGIIAVLNFSIIVVMCYTARCVSAIPNEVESLISSVHWLTRTAIRSALGPSAKQSLTDYAKSLPELVGLTGEKNIADKKNE